MWTRSIAAIVVALCGLVLFGGWGIAAPPAKDVPIVITVPKDGARVDRVEDLEGRFDPAQGLWPVIFVKPLDLADAVWFVQPEPELDTVRANAYSARVYFGDASTKSGQRFAVRACLAKSREEARSFKEGRTLTELPRLPCSAEIIVVRGDGEATKTRKVTFAGRDWEVKSAEQYGPGPNAWSDAEENVRIDDKGHLHLAITRRDGRWYCAEVVGPSLGYGEYLFCVSGDLAKLDPQTVLGLFVYKDEKHEIDILELSRWGDPENKNGQFVVQPPTTETLHRFDVGKAEVLTCSLVWSKEQVHARCWAGEDTKDKPLAEWKLAGPRVPEAGGERVRMNLWLVRGKPPSSDARSEVVIRSFQFTPAK